MSKSDFAAYTFYVNRPELLARAIDAFSDLQHDLTVVNNSGKKFVEKSEGDGPYFVANDVFEPLVPLSYSQSMNWMLQDANAKGVDFIIHFHSDAFSTNPLAVKQLLTYARNDKANGLRRGLWWTFYDILFALNVEALNEIGGWDTNFNSYFVDQDLKRRLRLSGWECHDTHIEGISHEGSATINSDPKLKLIHSLMFPLTRLFYLAKWGGDPEKETYKQPYNCHDFDLKP